MDKIDYKKQLSHLYKASAKKIAEIDVEPMQYLMVDGHGSPQDQMFMDAIETIYGMAYTLKFMLKGENPPFDSVVMPMEMLAWADDWSAFPEKRYDEWQWTMMIMQPDRVTQAHFAEAQVQLKAKKSPVMIDQCRLETMHEGTCVQVMHVGPYSEVGPDVQRLHERVTELGAQRHGKHHEIYLSDPRRTAPEKLKTIVRCGYRK